MKANNGMVLIGGYYLINWLSYGAYLRENMHGNRLIRKAYISDHHIEAAQLAAFYLVVPILCAILSIGITFLTIFFGGVEFLEKGAWERDAPPALGGTRNL